MEYSEQPWYVLPANLIQLGLDYSSKESDFDHQIAFLLLDVGVEAALKGFLSSTGDIDLKKINFPELCKKVEDDLQKRGQSGIDFKKVVYYHGIRNKQYHQGDGVVATKESLDGYGILAKEVLNLLTGIEVGELTPFQIAKKQEELRVNQEELKASIRKNIKSMQSNSGILVEALYPSMASRILNAQIAGLNISNPIMDYDRALVIDARQRPRFEQFLEMIGEHPFNVDLDGDTIDLFILCPEAFLIWIAFWELSEDFSHDWAQFLKMWAATEPAAWILSGSGKELDEGVSKWSRERASMVYRWVHDRFPDLITDQPDFRIEPLS